MTPVADATDPLTRAYDVVVVGGGNAALCAALSASQNGAKVLLLERAPEDERGGNSRYTTGSMRFVYETLDDIRELVPDLTEEQVRNTDFGTYSREQYLEDIMRMSEARADPDLAHVLVNQSLGTVKWLRSNGVEFLPNYGRQAFKHDEKYKFFGGMTLYANGEGPGLVDTLFKAVERSGVMVVYRARARNVLLEKGAVAGIALLRDGIEHRVAAKAVVLATGGFQANAEWRTRYLGENWDLAKVRGSRFNTGDGIAMAFSAGAMPWGHWSGAHATLWDYMAPPYGNLVVGGLYQKLSYAFGILVNARGERFVDEGADFHNFTYASYGREILKQPRQLAWQVFDSQVDHLLRYEYRIREATRVTADTLEEMAAQLDGVDPDAFLRTVHAYNAAADESVAFNPNIRDGKSTRGLHVPKSNWATRIIKPPFQAYAVTCGITFTYGGVRIDTNANVINEEGGIIPGLFATGEMVGGLFYFHYPSGAGLTNGAVFGRIAGAQAAAIAREARRAD